MNYTLRTVSPESGTFDQSLGECYGRVNRFENPKRFKEYFKQVFNKQYVSDLDESANDDTKNIIGFVISSKDSIIPIYQGNAFYIVSESGKTLVRINNCMNRQRPIDYGVEKTPPTEMQYYLNILDKGCRESLDTETISAWNLVKERLIKTRSDLK
tara:strand:+ start:7247 stop:7714 length:468 start_codon:yes stop_codon:yes gene_type:complete